MDKKDIRKAIATLTRYKQGKQVLEARVIENERWWRLRHWEVIEDNSGGDRQSTSGWLFNSICNKHADAMDNMPMPNILPREAADVETAKQLAAIIPLVLEQNNYAETYSNTYDDKLVNGTGIVGVFWDNTKLNGLGDISIVQQDVLNLFWEPGISNIQESKNVFNVQYIDNETLKEMYPEIEELGKAIELAEYFHDDSIDRSNQSAVIDWYYHKNGKLHFCKFIGEHVLFSTEDSEEFAETGLYDHGKYPFIFDPCYRIKGSPCGFGQVDVSKSAQERIDRLQQAIDKNAVWSAKPRYFRKLSSDIDLNQFADTRYDFVDVNGSMDIESLKQIEVTPLPSMCLSVLMNTVDELKETSGNRDFSQGSTTSGVTSGSAIAALQEAGTKLSRDMQKRTYRAYKEMIWQIIELIRQFYDEPRLFRILGNDGQTEFVAYDNSSLKKTSMLSFGDETSYREPIFDISVQAEKESPFSRMSQNDLAMQMYNMGFFNPQMGDSALACLKMMTFDGKDQVMQMVADNLAKFQAEQEQIKQQAMADAQAQMGGAPDDGGNVNAEEQPLYPTSGQPLQ